MKTPGLLSDTRVLFNLLFRSHRGATHAERLDSFYRGQAGDYDRFRERLLPGRRELVARLEAEPGAHWVDVGGGTAVTLDFLGARAALLGSYTVLDLCPSLLERASERISRGGHGNARAIIGDATEWRPAQGHADVVLFSYSLSMIPDWFAALDNALAMLRPGGLCAVVDFHVSRRHAAPPLQRHGAFTRAFWPLWFAWDGIHLNPDVIPYLTRRFETVHLSENRVRLPYVPGSRVPWFQFIGRKAVDPPLTTLQTEGEQGDERRCRQAPGKSDPPH